jgi:hypothetical protein
VRLVTVALTVMNRFSRESVCDYCKKAAAVIGGLCVACELAVGTLHTSQAVPAHESAAGFYVARVSAPGQTSGSTGGHDGQVHDDEIHRIIYGTGDRRFAVATPRGAVSKFAPPSTVRGRSPLKRTGWSGGSYGAPVTSVAVAA